MIVVNATEAARLAGVNERTVRRWIKQGKLDATRSGRENLVKFRDVRALASRTTDGYRYRRAIGRLHWKSPA